MGRLRASCTNTTKASRQVQHFTIIDYYFLLEVKRVKQISGHTASKVLLSAMYFAYHPFIIPKDRIVQEGLHHAFIRTQGLQSSLNNERIHFSVGK